MEKYLDYVADAYFGKMSASMQHKTRKRIEWIIKNTAGKIILDIGCSQGLVSVLLGREGKTVTGIDIAKESIDYANQLLLEEQGRTREHVQFINGDFLQESFPANHYETVIITEVLEHFYSSRELLEKIHLLLKDDGNVIVTVPFGINDYPDHKRTLYLTEIYMEMSQLFKVEKVEFMGKWIGFIGTKTEMDGTCIPEKLFEETEKAFFAIEREITDQNKTLKGKLQKNKESIEKRRQEETALVQRIVEYKETMDELTLKNRELEKIQAEHQKTLMNIQKNNDKQKKKWKEERNQLTKQLNRCSSMIKDLQTSKDKLQESYKSLLQRNSFEKKTHANSLAMLTDLNDVLKEQNSQLKINGEAFQFINQTVQRQNEDLFAKDLTIQKQMDQLAEQEQKIKSLEAEKAGMEEELAAIKEKSSEQDAFIAQIKDEANIERENYKIQKAELEKVINENVLLNEGLKLKIRMMDNRNKQQLLNLKEELLHALEEAESITEKLLQTQTEKDKWERKCKSLQNSKLGKVTASYWTLRKKILKRG